MFILTDYVSFQAVKGHVVSNIYLMIIAEDDEREWLLRSIFLKNYDVSQIGNPDAFLLHAKIIREQEKEFINSKKAFLDFYLKQENFGN